VEACYGVPLSGGRMTEPHDVMWMPFVFAAVAAGIVLVVARVSQDRRLRGLASCFEVGTFAISGTVARWARGRVEGFECRYRIVARDRNDPGGARLRVAALARLAWQATRSNAVSRVMVRVGLMKDVEIGDPGLDETLRFSATDGGGLKGALADARAREALRRLAATDNFYSATCDGDGLTVRWRPRARAVDENPDVVTRRIAASLLLLSALGCAPAVG
jgi:hypothetical protein